MRGAIAAGHPLTAEAGARVLREGGNAVDALLAAAFAGFVTEGPLTGPAGGGFLLVHEPSGATTVLDCFFGVPARSLGEMDELLVDFGDSGTQVFHVGEGSVAVPGILAGLEEAHGRFATRAWAELVEPAIELARRGFRARRAALDIARDPRRDPAARRRRASDLRRCGVGEAPRTCARLSSACATSAPRRHPSSCPSTPRTSARTASSLPRRSSSRCSGSTCSRRRRRAAVSCGGFSSSSPRRAIRA